LIKAFIIFTNNFRFMKKIIFSLAIMVSASALYAQHEGHNHDGHNHGTVASGKTTQDDLVLRETEYNFGKIPQGKPVTHEFEVVNSGKTEMKIQNVQASCGCTTPEWDRENAIPPGGSTKIKVGYNAAAEGAFNKSITLTYGDSQSKVFYIKGEVWKTPATSAPENKGLDDLKN
jgi:hypothetical protein